MTKIEYHLKNGELEKTTGARFCSYPNCKIRMRSTVNNGTISFAEYCLEHNPSIGVVIDESI
jgi:hypothetical protein